MIKPTKFLNLNNCILGIASEIIKILLIEKKVSYNILYKNLKSKYDKDFDYNFLPAIDFLFLLGKIKYSPSNDCLELIM